jgi:hypothetical protein
MELLLIAPAMAVHQCQSGVENYHFEEHLIVHNFLHI